MRPFIPSLDMELSVIVVLSLMVWYYLFLFVTHITSGCKLRRGGESAQEAGVEAAGGGEGDVVLALEVVLARRLEVPAHRRRRQSVGRLPRFDQLAQHTAEN